MCMLENPDLNSGWKHGSCQCHHAQKMNKPYSAPCWWWAGSPSSIVIRNGEWPELLVWRRTALPIYVNILIYFSSARFIWTKEITLLAFSYFIRLHQQPKIRPKMSHGPTVTKRRQPSSWTATHSTNEPAPSESVTQLYRHTHRLRL